MLDRRKILEKAHHDCLVEMYAKAQPPADFNKILEDVKSGILTDDEKNPIYKRHYLSYKEFEYILNKYCSAYRINREWPDNIDVIERYFKGEGRKDVWIPNRIDKDGFKHPGYRSSEAVPHIKDTIKNIIKDNEAAEKISEEIFNYLENCKNYYRFDTEESSFKVGISLGCSPISNKDVVIEYWKEQGVDIEIKDRNPMLLWDMDYYGDEFEDVMIDEYGNNWEEKTWNDYYATNEGKRELVEEYLRSNEGYERYYVRESENEKLMVINFDSGEEIEIDTFIENINQNIVY